MACDLRFGATSDLGQAVRAPDQLAQFAVDLLAGVETPCVGLTLGLILHCVRHNRRSPPCETAGFCNEVTYGRISLTVLLGHVGDPHVRAVGGDADGTLPLCVSRLRDSLAAPSTHLHLPAPSIGGEPWSRWAEYPLSTQCEWHLTDFVALPITAATALPVNPGTVSSATHGRYAP